MEGTRPWSRRAAAGSVGASQPTWWTCGHKEGWGGQPRRPRTRPGGQPRSRPRRRAIRTGVRFRAGSLWEPPPEAAWCQSSARCPARLDSHIQSRGDGSLLAGRILCRATALGGGPLSWLRTQRDDEVSRRRDGFGDLTMPRLSAPPDTPLTDATASPRGLPVHRAGRRPRGLGTAARPAAPLGQWPQWPLMASPPFPRACQGRPRLQPWRPAGRLRLPLGASAWAAPP